MRSRTILASLSAGLMTASMFASAPAEAVAPPTPSSITSVSASPGPGVGQITFRWKQSGKNTDYFLLETALSSFSKTSSTMNRTGRYSHLTKITRTARSLTLSASQAGALGARYSYGNNLYYRFYAVNKSASGTSTRAYPYLQSVMPRQASPKASGTRIRIATFNVKSAKASGSGARSWLNRRSDVAAEIISHNPGVVAIQELSPGRADGKSGGTIGAIRQTTSLESALRAKGAGKYRLVRTTSYIKIGEPAGSQGERILYDTSRYQLLSYCPETTGGRGYNTSCAFKLPMLSSDNENTRTVAAVAQFRDRRTGARFYFVSAHLNSRHSANTSLERSYNALRGSQANAINTRLAALNTARVPVIIGGDFNSWQNILVGNAAHDQLVMRGYYDTAAAMTRVNLKYGTSNAFATTMTANVSGFGARLDAVLVKGVTGTTRYENVMKRVDSSRPSDHNLILADIVL